MLVKAKMSMLMLSVGIRFHGHSRVARDATVMALAIPSQEVLAKVNAPPAANQ